MKKNKKNQTTKEFFEQEYKIFDKLKKSGVLSDSLLDIIEKNFLLANLGLLDKCPKCGGSLADYGHVKKCLNCTYSKYIKQKGEKMTKAKTIKTRKIETKLEEPKLTGRLITEGDEGSDKMCPLCGSSFKRKWLFFKTDKCINPKCKNYFGNVVAIEPEKVETVHKTTKPKTVKPKTVKPKTVKPKTVKPKAKLLTEGKTKTNVKKPPTAKKPAVAPTPQKATPKKDVKPVSKQKNK